MNALLDVVGVRKAFGSLLAVDDVSFSVRPGEILGIAGPNGAGKTTLFNLISGIPFSADRGTVTFDGVRIEAMRADRIFELGLAQTFQREASFRKLTVEQNVKLGVRFGTKLKSAERSQAVEGALEAFDLAGSRYESAGSLTVYETKRLMLASAVVGKPKLLMLDEPTLGLAPKLRGELAKAIHAIAGTGVGLLVVDQDIDMLLGLCDRLYLIEQGRVAMDIADRTQLQHQDVLQRYFGSAA